VGAARRMGDAVHHWHAQGVTGRGAVALPPKASQAGARWHCRPRRHREGCGGIAAQGVTGRGAVALPPKASQGGVRWHSAILVAPPVNAVMVT